LTFRMRSLWKNVTELRFPSSGGPLAANSCAPAAKGRKNMPAARVTLADDLDLLLAVMPRNIQAKIEENPQYHSLLEIVLDLGRIPEARYPGSIEELSEHPVSLEELNYVVSRVARFGDDNRAGIERTLHRISAFRNRSGSVIGLTCRVGRAVFGTVDIVRDVVESGHSLLLLGRPGVGKTTLLREAARVLADDFGKRVIIVDTSNEIGGDGDIPHPGIGRARRMQVPTPGNQHGVMIEAVENHMPEVIVIDEIGTEAEALAARTIAERGVQLIATVHGNTLENLLQNPSLSDLVGGLQSVTLSDEEARRRGTQKTVLERKLPPTFNVVIEIQEKDRLAVHHDVASVIDYFLRGFPFSPEVRIRTGDGSVEVHKPQDRDEAEHAVEAVGPARGSWAAHRRGRRKNLRVFPYGVGRVRLERAIRNLGVPVVVSADAEKADVILTLKSQEKRQSKRLREIEARGVPFHLIRSNTATQIENFLRSIFSLQETGPVEEIALQEAEVAMIKVLDEQKAVELAPRNSGIRRLQHLLADQHGLRTESKGREPYRRVVIHPS